MKETYDRALDARKKPEKKKPSLEELEHELREAKQKGNQQKADKLQEKVDSMLEERYKNPSL